jgi:RNA polymerase sigma factor (sigma-70 family)
MPRQPDSRQLDLFVAFIGDLPLRDEREAMSLPFCSLSKRKRLKPIEFTNRDGSRWCRVTANPKFGMATIYDLDVMMWAISQLNEAVENGLKTSPTISFQPYDLLKSIGRQTGGDHYKRLEAALQRLQSTSIETTIRADQRRQTTMFSWIDSWQHEVDEATGRSRGMRITVPNWLYQAVVRRVADHFRSLYRRERVVHELSQSIEEHQEEEGLDRIATIETHEILRDAIGRLAGQDREIIVLKFTHNWSYKRIGERFSIPERAVEYRLVCAKRQLRKELQNLTGANDE